MKSVTSMNKWATFLSAVIVLVVAASCTSGGRDAAASSPRITATTTKAEQQAMTPAQALVLLKAGNERFAAGQSRTYDYRAQAVATATGQYPFATVLSCIDSRSAPEVIFDLSIGDAFVPRIAGNIATPELIGSMEFACKVAGAKVIVVMGHTECGAVKGACDDVKLGNLSLVMADINPAVAAVLTSGDRTSKNKAFVQQVALENVRLNIALIRARSPVLAEMEAKGELVIVGAMHDLATGVVSWL
jgi:carbonic anhydrase